MTLRAAIYTRLVSEQQSSESHLNQISACRRYIDNQGWDLVGTYEDSAIKVTNALARSGYQRMMRDAEAGVFDIVVTEEVDRLSRNMSDLARCHEELAVRRIQMHTANHGQVTPMHVAVLGTMAQLQSADLAARTKRGQLNRVRAGKIPAGVTYGYDTLSSTMGSRTMSGRRINQEQAAIVDRIFTDYAAGKPPKMIADDLNEEGVPGPGGRPWSSTAICGRPTRGTGIVNNSLYAGRLTWNRHTYVKDLATGKRIARLNNADLHVVVALPELRIIDDELWQTVRGRQAAGQT